MQMSALYKEVTDKIVKELEAGAVPWVQPWKHGKATGIMPQNAATGRPYSGGNILLLWIARKERGYPTAGWMTYTQAGEKGGQVRKGEKGIAVIFTKKVTYSEEEDERTVQLARSYTVFNVAQIDGLPNINEPAELVHFERSDANKLVDRFIKAPGVPIRFGGNKACYVPSQDFIALPEETAFKTIEHHYATALHELVHSTGHETRLNRQLKNRFGSEEYAAEELVAELGSAFLCAHLQVEGELRHAGYIDHWIRLLKKDDRAIFTAASQASKAADYLRAFSTEAGDGRG